MRGSSIGGDSDGPATLHSSSGDEPSSSEPSILSLKQQQKNEEVLHDAQLEMEEDDPIAAGTFVHPLGSPRACPGALEAPPTRVGLHDFELLSVVGQGAFGKVGAPCPHACKVGAPCEPAHACLLCTHAWPDPSPGFSVLPSLL